MNYPDTLTELLNKIIFRIQDGEQIADCMIDLAHESYRLGLEKGWQYQQEEDNASRQWEDSDE